MERRVLIAIFLSFLVLYVYQALFVKSTPKPATSAASATTSAPAAPGAPATPAAAAKQPAEPKAAPAPAATAAAANATGATPLVGDTAEHDVTVETRDVIAVFTNRGATLKSWRLKHYFDQNRQPQELVATELASTQPLPFSLRADDDATTAELNTALYTVSGVPSGDAAESSQTTLTFEFRDSNGLRAVKRFTIDPASYIIGFSADVSDQNRALSPAIVWGPAVGDVSEISRYTKKAEGLVFPSGKTKPDRLSPKDIAKQSRYQGDFRYAGVDDNYFLTVALSPGQSSISFQPVAIPPPPGSKDSRELVSYTLQPASAQGLVKFFAGPKDFDVLSAINPDLAKSIDFGMFAIIVVPLLRSLKWINGYVGNYGWSIILLTVIINGIMFPLRHKSVVSMRKMQEVQPQVKAIQDRYAKFKATDPARQKMNQELMALYKEKGVNPASGCVPMLLTLPVLFAFYALLEVAIELRGAPFIFWIRDLSAHDPYYVTPILMGISQVWQQKITPAAGADPAQQKMMMMMPVVFTVMFLWAPAGLAIYWFTSNLWGIGQQYLTNYLIGPPKVHAVRPPAERRLKRVGGGKTEAAAKTE